jgi:hypothetical protein
MSVPRIPIHRIEADGLNVFYREAGAVDAQAVVCYMAVCGGRAKPGL